MSTQKFKQRTKGPTTTEVLTICPSCRAGKCDECNTDDCGCSGAYHTQLASPFDVRRHVKKHGPVGPLVSGELENQPLKQEVGQQLHLALPLHPKSKAKKMNAVRKSPRGAHWFRKMDPRNRTQ